MRGKTVTRMGMISEARGQIEFILLGAAGDRAEWAESY
jgi:hypothetical protein